MNNNPIDQHQFLSIVTDNPGITRLDAMKLLGTDKDRMGRAQKAAVHSCWLFVQTVGAGKDAFIRYFTMQYAVDNKLKARVKANKKLGNRADGGYQHSPYTMEFMKHCKRIDSCWITGRA